MRRLGDIGLYWRLRNARSDLATQSGSRGTRLKNVYFSHLHCLREKDFPEHLRPVYHELVERLTQVPGDKYIGSVEMTTSQMHWKQSKRCAELIVTLADWADEALYSTGRGKTQ